MSEQAATATKKEHRNDLILLGVLLMLSSVGVLLYLLFSSGGEYAAVYVNGELYGRYSLNKDITVEITDPEYPQRKNILVIADGCASITDASCPDRICVNEGKKAREGESIICLPNKVVVAIEGGSEVQYEK